MSFIDNRIYWVSGGLLDAANPTGAELGAAVPLDSFIAVNPEAPAALSGEAADAVIASLQADVAGAFGVPASMVAAQPPAFSERFVPRLGDLLSRIDHTLDGLCPCGAEPREGSAYCSYDCEPNIVGEHTDLSGPGVEFATPMRWRPDLVTAAPDANLVPIDYPPMDWGRGRTATLFERTDRPEWHLRLDDGHRFVGMDIPLGGSDTEVVERLADAGRRLSVELTNQRHLVPERPHPRTYGPQVTTHVARGAITVTAHHEGSLLDTLNAWLRTNGLDPGRIPMDSEIRVTARDITVVYSVLNDAGDTMINPEEPNAILTQPFTVPVVEPLPTEILTAAFDVMNPPHPAGLDRAALDAAAERIRVAHACVGESCARVDEAAERLRQALAVCGEHFERLEPGDRHSETQARIERHGHGPQDRRRAPRRIDPRRGR